MAEPPKRLDLRKFKLTHYQVLRTLDDILAGLGVVIHGDQLGRALKQRRDVVIDVDAVSGGAVLVLGERADSIVYLAVQALGVIPYRCILLRASMPPHRLPLRRGRPDLQGLRQFSWAQIREQIRHCRKQRLLCPSGRDQAGDLGGDGGGVEHGRHEEWPGISVFFKNDANEVFHTYSTYGRGVEVMMGTYNMLDLTPKGRDERDAEYKMEWVRHHDRYEPSPVAKAASAAGSVQGLFDTLKSRCCH